jgi:tRNA(fMet)-specific endonuclease VapC
MVVLDTDHLTLLERPSSPDGLRLWQRLQPVPPGERAATLVSFEEQSRGWLAYVSRARTTQERVDAFHKLHLHLKNYCSLTVLDFNINAGGHFDVLLGSRLRVGTKDLQIAAITLSQSATLLSRNLRDFRRVPGLKVEDWTQ